ncbi:MAG: transporter substrate-binding domain-containing protein [Selenomonadaceae bacterium]|nr:transporter substrate-binding domain-containing protein [Selenomonadaceae bacterium]
MRKLLILLTLLMGIVTITGCGQDSADKSNKSTLRVGTDASRVPFAFQDEQSQKYSGFDLDIIKAIAQSQNLKIKISSVSSDNLIPALQSGDLDIVISNMAVTPEREEQVFFSEPYCASGYGIIAPKKNGYVREGEDLAGLRTGIVKGSPAADAVRKIVGTDGAKFEEFATMEEAMESLKAGDLDVVVNDILSNNYYYKKIGKDYARIVDNAISNENLAIAVAKGNAELLDKINKGLADIKANGEYDKIYKRWFGN